MSDILHLTRARRWSERRTDWAPAPQLPPAAEDRADAGARIGQARSLPAPASGPIVDPIFFYVRSLLSAEQGRTLQLGFVDARGGVILSLFTRWPSGVVAVEPLDGGPMAGRLQAACRGADLVGFHRLLQGGLLPEGALEGAASLNCLWRRLQSTGPGPAPTRLGDALAAMGMAPPASEDAVDRALAVRELWLRLDRMG